MKYIDVFNGDADGICALHQLRLDNPQPDARLVSGVKRDINLLSRLTDVRNSQITVLDISLDRNRADLETVLSRDNTVLYADHHFAGSIPVSSGLTAHIDPEPLTCTSLIINNLLKEQYTPWAIVGAFGDNLDETAIRIASRIGLEQTAVDQMKETGILLNYNGYGATVDDLFFSPEDLYCQVRPYVNPLVFYAESPALQTLSEGYRTDMERAASHAPIHQDASGRVYQLPAEPWARRVAGVYSNTLARQEPGLGHVLMSANEDSTLRISVRAPLDNRTGADVLCRQFPTGGGRAAAAGINELPPEQLDAFIKAFSRQFTQ